MTTPSPTSRPPRDGRDELNLADFPISVLSRTPPIDVDGRKIDRVVYEATAYDPATRRRMPQRVTLTTSPRCGLPTPADENVVLALLHTARRAHGFAEPRVHFSPHQLFGVMRWDANGRSYTRLSEVLVRLKSLTILYENAWWDPSGRRYQEQFATGILAEYRLVKSRIRRKSGVSPESYVHWTPSFHASLAAGNLKALDLDRLFGLESPTAQRMYRLLDKRFYNADVVEMDLREFACGHLGVPPNPNVAELKRRLVPAVAELEALGFVEPAAAGERFLKVKTGVWRVRFRRVGSASAPAPTREKGPGHETHPPPCSAPADAGRALVAAFYAAWDTSGRSHPSENDLSKGRELSTRLGADVAAALVGPAVALLRAKFPAARRFGAALPYFEEADRARRAALLRRAGDEEADRRRKSARDESAAQSRADEAFFAAWSPVWEALGEPQREAIRAQVLREQPYLARPLLLQSRLAARFFLDELARRKSLTREDA